MWIANDICHRRLLPMLIDLCVALPASLGADIMRRSESLRLLRCFLRRQRANASDEENEVPTVIPLCLMRVMPCGHSRQLDAIFDDVVNRAVRKILRLRRAEIGHTRIERLAHWRKAAAVVSVASLATSHKSVAAVL